MSDTIEKRVRGFARMTQDERNAIASRGGKAAHQKGKAHKWTSEEAAKAGRIGGKKSKRRRKWVPSEV
jgi:hypothetical protein